MPVDFEIVGVFDMFPTWYPNDEDSGPLFVANLDYIFQEAGGQYPYNVWLRIDPDIPSQQIIDGVRDQGLRVQSWQDSVTFITEELQRPQRQGLFGLLSVGFIAAALLTVLGFMLYAFFSFRRRFIELGVLRAVGLSARQMTAFLGWELVFLMSVGLSAGTGLGILVSNLIYPLSAGWYRCFITDSTFCCANIMACGIPDLHSFWCVVYRGPWCTGMASDADEDIPGDQTG